MLITLKIVGDAGGYREISFRKPGEYIIGRVETAQCQVDDGRVSKHHCVLIVHPPEMKVKDLLSANGTIVDGTPLGAASEATPDGNPTVLREIPVRNGSVIQVGSTKIHIELGLDPADQAKAERWMTEAEKRVIEAVEYLKHVTETDPANTRAQSLHAELAAIAAKFRA